MGTTARSGLISIAVVVAAISTTVIIGISVCICTDRRPLSAFVPDILAGIIAFGILSLSLATIIILEKISKRESHADEQERIRKQYEAEQESIRKKRESEQEHLRKQHAAEQDRIKKTLIQLQTRKQEAIEILPSAISEAEAALDLATFEFDEGAFVPFWDAVEKAVSSLKSYDDGIRTIASTSTGIPDVLKKLDSPPRINESELIWPDASPTIKRMHQIVRQAQKNIDFTTIYLQRRTNGILVAGFANLGSAIEDMGSRIEGSINTLKQTLESTMYVMSTQNAEFHQESLAAMEAQTEQAATNAEAQKEMLNNIQRRRMPITKEFRDGQY